MKKYTLLAAFIISALNGMDNQQPMELSDPVLSHLLKTYNIPITDRAIFHIGCTTGKVSTELAQKASRVHVFDQDQKFIDDAKNKYQDHTKITFEHCNPVTFNFPRQCDLAIIDYTALEDYSHTNYHAKELFQCMRQHVSQNGEIFLSITTSDNTPHPNIDAAKEMAPTLQPCMLEMTKEEIINLMIPQYPSTQDLLTTLEETGFEVMTHEEHILARAISKDTFDSLLNNTITQNPIYGCIEDVIFKSYLANQFVLSYMIQLEQFMQSHEQNMHICGDNINPTDVFEPAIVTIFRARKK